MFIDRDLMTKPLHDDDAGGNKKPGVAAGLFRSDVFDQACFDQAWRVITSVAVQKSASFSRQVR
jgi:hypothetical protein